MLLAGEKVQGEIGPWDGLQCHWETVPERPQLTSHILFERGHMGT